MDFMTGLKRTNYCGDLRLEDAGKEVTVAGNVVNPTGYQTVLYVTLALYLVAFIISMVFIKPVKNEK